MISRVDLAEYLHSYLNVTEFSDYAPNGLQIEGCNNISTIVTGVSASKALIDRAVALKADAILVHHGYFWKNEEYPIVGIKKQRIAQLLNNDINLFAYHLPLDAHPEIGNNKKLAEIFDIEITGNFITQGSQTIGNVGRFKKAIDAKVFAKQLEEKLERTPLHIEAASKTISSIAWCSGGAQSSIELAIEKGVDAYLTGEVSEQTTHLARESCLHFFAAGHHATERYGIKALGEHLAEKYKLSHHFVDIPNPV